jgi:Flp pilus assembly pilin Flp
MLTFLAYLQSFLPQRPLRDDRGVTSVEYALLLTLIGGVLLTAVIVFGGTLSGVFSGFKF